MLSFKKLFKRQLTNILDGQAESRAVADRRGCEACLVGHHLWIRDFDNISVLNLSTRHSRVFEGLELGQWPLKAEPGTLDDGTPVVGLRYRADEDCLSVRTGDTIIEIWSQDGQERLYLLNRQISWLPCQDFSIVSGVLVTMYPKDRNERPLISDPTFLLFTRLRDLSSYILCLEERPVLHSIVLPPAESGQSLENYGLQLGLEGGTVDFVVMRVSGFLPLNRDQREPRCREIPHSWTWSDGKLRSNDSAAAPLPALSARKLFSSELQYTIRLRWNGFLSETTVNDGSTIVESWTFDPCAPDQTLTPSLALRFPESPNLGVWIAVVGSSAFVSSEAGLDCIYRPFTSEGRRIFHLSDTSLRGLTDYLSDGSLLIYGSDCTASCLIFRIR